MLPDFHLHTEFSGDSQTPVRDQIERCLSLGMTEMCVTDHHDYAAGSDGDLFLLDIDRYLPALRQFQEEYAGRIRVGIGIELGLQCSIRDYLNRLVAGLDVDYLIGSCHYIDGLDPYYPEYFQGKTEREAYERYFAVTLKRVQALDCFDAFGHLDYIVRYGPSRNEHYSYAAYRDFIDPILRVLIEKGKALECNTAGFRYGLGHPNPTEDVLRRYREMGGELLTLGSDAHEPRYVAYAFPQVPEMLKACGFRYYTTYHHRRPIMHSL